MKTNHFKKTVIFSIIVISAIGVGFILGRSTNSNRDVSSFNLVPSLFKDEVDFSLIKDAWDLIHKKYVGIKDVDDQILIIGAVRGMVDSLGDPHSAFFNSEETEDFLTDVSGRFDGIGIEITLRDGVLAVIAPLKDTPAYRAGIRAGDKIVKINGKSTDNIILEEAVSRIRGPRGTQVILTIKRDSSSEVIDIPIIRDEIKVSTVEWELVNDKIAYIEIRHFSEPTAKDFSQIVQEVLKSNADRIVLDLRNNPGGFLDSAIEIAGWFLPKNSLVVKEEALEYGKREHKSSGSALLKDFPIVILQNEGSASASEILAGALRDNKKIVIIGEKSFGKGSVQSLESLQGGTSIKLTVAKWITPSGQYINEKGIEPDIYVEAKLEDLENDIDKQKEKAIEKILSL